MSQDLHMCRVNLSHLVRFGTHDIRHKWSLPSGLIQYHWDSPLYITRGVRLQLKKIVLLSEDLVYLNNSVDLNKMPHYMEFHLGLHCL